MDSRDRDLAIRTVLGEAGDQGDAGMLGVANVILNRVASGRYGQSAADVVLAPHQFEPWATRSQQLMAYSPDSPAYQRAGQIFDAVAGGQAPDNTNGSTHFYAPELQARLGRSAPAWGRGQPTATIGGHAFFAPEGAVKRQQQASGPDVDALLRLYGGTDAPAPASTENAAGGPPDGPDVDALMKLYGGGAEGQPAALSPAAAPVPQGPLTATPGDNTATSLAKNVGTGAFKGIGDAAGAVGNAGHLADYLMARAESAITKQPADAILADLARQRDQEQQNPTVVGQIAAAVDPRRLLPDGQTAYNALRDYFGAGEYVPTSDAGKMVQAATETAVGSLGPGVRGTSVTGPATAATVASPGMGNALKQAMGQMPAAATSGAFAQYVTDRTGDPLLGLAAGAAPAVALGTGAAGLNKLIGTAAPETAALAQTARDKFGIPVNAAQISDSPAMRFASSTVNKMPLSGAGAERAVQQTAFNRAVAGTFGEDADRITPNVMQAAKTRLGGEFDRIAAGTTIDPVNAQLLGSNLSKIMKDAVDVLPDSEVQPLARQVYNIAASVQQHGGTIPGEVYQALTRKGTPLDRVMSSSDPNVAHYGSQIRNALDDALQASAPPEMAADLGRARLQYKSLKTIEPLAEKSTTGDISPPLLMGAVRNKFGGMAYGGGGDMGDLARIGQRFLKEPPSSGTAERLGVMGLLSQLGSGAASVMMGDPTPFAITAAGIPASLLAARGVRSFLGSEGATNRLIAASLGQAQQPGVANRLMSSGGVPAFLYDASRLPAVLQQR